MYQTWLNEAWHWRIELKKAENKNKNQKQQWQQLNLYSFFFIFCFLRNDTWFHIYIYYCYYVLYLLPSDMELFIVDHGVCCDDAPNRIAQWLSLTLSACEIAIIREIVSNHKCEMEMHMARW